MLHVKISNKFCPSGIRQAQLHVRLPEGFRKAVEIHFMEIDFKEFINDIREADTGSRWTV